MKKILPTPNAIFFEAQTGPKMSRCHLAIKYIQFDRANSNSVLLNSPLFHTHNHFRWISPSVIYYQLFWTHWLCINEWYKLYSNVTNHWSLPSLINQWVVNESNSFCSHTPIDCWHAKFKEKVLTADTMPFLTRNPIFLKPPVDKASFIKNPLRI